MGQELQMAIAPMLQCRRSHVSLPNGLRHVSMSFLKSIISHTTSHAGRFDDIQDGMASRNRGRGSAGLDPYPNIACDAHTAVFQLPRKLEAAKIRVQDE